MPEQKKKICLFVNAKAWEQVKKISKETGASLTYLVNKAIEKEYWKNKEKQETKGA